jgi:large subunit ribosomal protein L9
MRVILRSDLKGVGNKGDIIDVANGYGRNFLLPRGLAFVATDGAATQAESMRRSRDVKDAADRAAAEEVAKSLVSSPVTIEARAGADEKLFGSVTSADIADAVSAQTGVEIDRKQLQLSEPIRSLGTHLVPVKLHANVEFPVTVHVVAS